jgi:hypothetical protein
MGLSGSKNEDRKLEFKKERLIMMNYASEYFHQLIEGELKTLSAYSEELVHLQVPAAPDESLSRWNSAGAPSPAFWILDGHLNYSDDIEGLLQKFREKLRRRDRLAVVLYSPYLGWIYRLLHRLGLRSKALPTTFLTQTDLSNLSKLAEFEVVRTRYVGFFPFRLFGVGTLLNQLLPLIPGLRRLSLAQVAVLRPLGRTEERPSLSIVIPARNERGNIEAALQRMPDLGCELEILFVEGNSTDGTWEEIERVAKKYAGRFKIQTHKQPGKGKNDAVRVGFRHATGDVLTILDADLTMPPELLGRFYEAYRSNKADFVNGTRLVYPMEGEAMRFLNKLGNVFFAKALSYVLGVPLGDSLCGTKLLSRKDYERVVRWRCDFGDFDPFGDFELLFPAAILGMGILDVPIRYRARTYGSTNISRFKHGWMLLRMTTIGLLRVATGSAPSQSHVLSR